MFTGIVQVLGSVASVQRVDFGAILTIDPQGWEHQARPGESIAVNGCCLRFQHPTSQLRHQQPHGGRAAHPAGGSRGVC